MATSAPSTNRFMQDPASMSPATSIAVGLVYFGDFMDSGNRFNLDDIPEQYVICSSTFVSLFSQYTRRS
jgi:hypothetical protein